MCCSLFLNTNHPSSTVDENVYLIDAEHVVLVFIGNSCNRFTSVTTTPNVILAHPPARLTKLFKSLSREPFRMSLEYSDLSF